MRPVLPFRREGVNSFELIVHHRHTDERIEFDGLVNVTLPVR